MRADSLLQGVRRVDEQGDRLLAVRTFSDTDPSRRIDETIDVLLDLAELLRAGAPFPPRTEGDPSRSGGTDTERKSLEYRPDGGFQGGGATDTHSRRDDLVRRVLETSYERGSAPIELFDSETVDRVTTDDRLETVDSWVIVPLSSIAPYADNWHPVIETLLEHLDEILEDFRRVERRVRVAESDRALRADCGTVVEMLETLVFVIRRAVADSRYVHRRTDQRQAELLSTIERATTQLGSDHNA
ncbi:hypothetical protein [Natronorubrum tibetense]|uniref:Uncharacterized protein n=1 Tax=Natronorubrum tibetense GA33 TaxID=1114856 RepID=L9W5K0_9EURY|nr:hypothetical protein [Natronorubrum tibetense]ELY44632.1 hypothetical protein C496_04530 [Natronorubrum tibetense GA33]